MENEMIERMARAIYDNVSDLYLMGDEDWKHVARAAVAAMRGPTEQQRTAYYGLSFRTEIMVDAHWERAIDAILKSE